MKQPKLTTREKEYDELFTEMYCKVKWILEGKKMERNGDNGTKVVKQTRA